MKYLTVPALGTGTAADPFRPDLPAGASFVGTRDTSTGTYLVAVLDAATIPVKAGTTSLTPATQAGAIATRGLSPTAVDAWRVS